MMPAWEPTEKVGPRVKRFMIPLDAVKKILSAGHSFDMWADPGIPLGADIKTSWIELDRGRLPSEWTIVILCEHPAFPRVSPDLPPPVERIGVHVAFRDERTKWDKKRYDLKINAESPYYHAIMATSPRDAVDQFLELEIVFRNPPACVLLWGPEAGAQPQVWAINPMNQP